MHHEFCRQWKVDCKQNSRSVMKLRNASENCKHILSRMQTAQCSVESLYEGIDFQSTISRLVIAVHQPDSIWYILWASMLITLRYDSLCYGIL